MGAPQRMNESEQQGGNVPHQVGEVGALYRYPVKSMRGELLENASLGWHGLDGDRRLALRRLNDGGGFPWLTATKLPELILFSPQRAADGNELPTHVRTPDGEELEIHGHELAAEISRRHGSPVEMMHLSRGIFDEASVSLITTATVEEIGRAAAQPPDARRFRPNVLIMPMQSTAFEEDEWVGGSLSFGAGNDAATIGVTNHDVRCSMVNLEPDTARATAEVLRAIVRERNNKAGVYGTVTRRGRLAVGQPVFFHPERSLAD